MFGDMEKAILIHRAGHITSSQARTHRREYKQLQSTRVPYHRVSGQCFRAIASTGPSNYIYPNKVPGPRGYEYYGLFRHGRVQH